DIPLNTIARDPYDPKDTIYVGTDVGVFQTINCTANGGPKWHNMTLPNGLPNVQVNDLKAIRGTGYLNAATYGRGIWRAALTLPPLNYIYLVAGPVWVLPGDPIQFHVYLNQEAPGEGIVVRLSASNPDALRLPTSVRIEGGQIEADFMGTAAQVPNGTHVLVTASYGETGKQTEGVISQPITVSGFVTLAGC